MHLVGLLKRSPEGDKSFYWTAWAQNDCASKSATWEDVLRDGDTLWVRPSEQRRPGQFGCVQFASESKERRY